MDNNKKDSSLKNLIKALDSEETFLFGEYIITYNLREIMDDINALRKSLPVSNNDDLKAFTMAAMKGLCANANVTTVYDKANSVLFAQDLELAAINIANLTLSELSKRK